MTKIGKFLTHGTVAALIGIGAMVVIAPTASAHVVCNRMGDCWSTHTRYAYPRELGIRLLATSDCAKRPICDYCIGQYVMIKATIAMVCG